MANEFFPYRYLAEPIPVEVEELTLDGEPAPNLIQADKALIDLSARSRWRVLSLSISVSLDPQVLAELIPPLDDRAGQPWKVVVIIAHLTETGQLAWRQIQPLSSTDSDRLEWQAQINLNHDDVSARVRLRTFITRSNASSAAPPQYASEVGLRLGASGQWTIQVDPRQAPPGTSLNIQWVNFRTCENERLNDVASCLYSLDLDQNPPVLYLNEFIPDLKTVLNHRAYTGVRAAVRDALYRSIAQPVWMALVLAAASGDWSDESERAEWERAALQKIAPLTYPDVDPEAAVKKLILDASGTADGRNALLQKLPDAVQQQLELSKSTGRLFASALEGE